MGCKLQILEDKGYNKGILIIANVPTCIILPVKTITPKAAAPSMNPKP